MMTDAKEQEIELLKREAKKKKRALVFLFLFLGLGYYLFSPLIPKDMSLQFDLPMVFYNSPEEFSLHEAITLEAVLSDKKHREVAKISLALKAQEGPYSSPFFLKLAPGDYHVEATVKGPHPLRHQAQLKGQANLQEGRVIIPLRLKEL